MYVRVRWIDVARAYNPSSSSSDRNCWKGIRLDELQNPDSKFNITTPTNQ